MRSHRWPCKYATFDRSCGLPTRPDFDNFQALYPRPIDIDVTGAGIAAGADSLMAMADVFDALISRRIYKEALPFAAVRTIIAEERGRLFDPDIADAFLADCGEFEAIALHFGIER